MGVERDGAEHKRLQPAHTQWGGIKYENFSFVKGSTLITESLALYAS